VRRLILVAVALVLCAFAAGSPAALASFNSLRVINYAATNEDVEGMWSTWQPTVIEADLGRIEALHANTVRIFAPIDTCWGQLVCQYQLDELSQFVSMANADGLRVWITLYPYAETPSVSQSEQYVSAIIGPFAGATGKIAALEVYNEIIPINYPNGWAQWAQAVIPYARSVAGGIPITISAAGGESIPNTSFSDLVSGLTSVGTQPDFYDYHYAYDSEMAQTILQQAEGIAGSVPIVVGETGQPTDCYEAYLGGCSSKPQRLLVCGPRFYPKLIAGGPTLEQSQATYLANVESGTFAAGLGAAGVWTLNDQSQSCTTPYTSPSSFGLYRPDGSPKPSVGAVAQAFINAGG